MNGRTETARRIAETHYLCEPGITRIFTIVGSAEVENQGDEPIKLLEVNSDTIASGIMPLGFGPDPTNGIDHRSIIVEITPDEFQQLESGELCLPAGWRIQDEVPRPVEGRLGS